MPIKTHTDHSLEETADNVVQDSTSSSEADQISDTKTSKNANKKQEVRIASRQLLSKLYENYPEVFRKPGSGKPVVLAIGLHKELQKVIQEWGFNNATLRAALAWYTRQLRYQRAVIESTHRINLDGTEAEEISLEQKNLAQKKIDETNDWLSQHHPEKLQKKPKKEFGQNDKTNGAIVDKDSTMRGRVNQKRASSSDDRVFKKKSKPSPKVAKSNKTNELKEAPKSTANVKNMDEKLLDLVNKFNK